MTHTIRRLILAVAVAATGVKAEPGSVKLEGTPIYPGVSEGCHAFTDASMSDPTRPQIEVCGDVKVTVYLKEACGSYDWRGYKGMFEKQLGCSAGCTTESPAADAWISRAGSYKIEKCEGEL